MNVKRRQRRLEKRLRKRKGFTLVELLIVVVIILVLASIAIMKLSGSDKGARIASMMSDARNAITAEESYYMIEKQYVDANVDASNNPDGASEDLGNGIKIVASPFNTVSVQTITCNDNSPGFTVSVTSSKTDKQVSYDSCTDTSPKVTNQ